MWIFFRFVPGIYLKNFFIIFLSLLGFYCGIDLLLNFSDLPNAANLSLLYVIFLAFSAVTYVLPVSLIFTLVLSLVSMIRANEFVSLYALGLSKNLVIIFPFLWALFFCFVYVGLNFTLFACTNDYKRNILKNGTMLKQSGEVFLKFNNEFTYISKANNGQSIAQNIKVSNIKDLNLNSFIKAKSSIFEKKNWTLKERNLILLPKEYELGNKGLNISEFKELNTLEDFKPKVIEGVTSDSDYFILDILESLELFKTQSISVESLKTSLYKLVFMSFFAPFLMLIMYYFFPVIARFSDLAFVAFVAFVVTLFTWSMLFLLSRLSEDSVILSELGIVMPIVLLIFLDGFMLYKHR